MPPRQGTKGRRSLAALLLALALFACCAQAETGAEAWLRYARLDQRAARRYSRLPPAAFILGDSIVVKSAQGELVRGLQGMLGRSLRTGQGRPTQPAILLGTLEAIRTLSLSPPLSRFLAGDAFWLTRRPVNGFDALVIAGGTDRGVLCGVFALLRKIARGEEISDVDEVETPSAPIRWVNQWDNLEGSIERGYAGASIFFANGRVRADLTRAADYAHLLASIGINGCTINNVNANPRILDSDFIPQVARIADAFRPWGVRLSLSVDLGAPQRLGGLPTFDPLDPQVAQWWRAKVDEIYRAIPDFGGFVVKADSEGRVGPSTYGRTHADAANVIARALKPHGGLVFYRAFVYDHHLDWRNLKNDRAKAAYDNFHPLDGKFDDNAIVQIKYGPIDFQVIEPVSPLFSGLHETNEAIELQITQEYTGQQRHLCFLLPMWQEILNFDLHGDSGSTPVKDLVAGKTFHRPTGGFVGVANVGMDTNWLAHPLAMANLYAFGRVAWNPNLTSEQIIDEWTRLTFGSDPLVVRTIDAMELISWRVYESYTGPLGAGTLTNILGSHYGPGPASSEENGWGQWHRADHAGVGMDRTLATGTGFIGQYSPAVQKKYESLAECPDDLLLFFHHVPYLHVLHSGKTVIQHIYDSHYDGAAHAAAYVDQWRALAGHIDDDRYREVLGRLQYQAGHAIIWRDAICNWFYRLSGIPDQQGRVGNHPGRIEAEAMHLTGYVPTSVVPWEAASAGKAVVCAPSAHECTADYRFRGTGGRYALRIAYFDQNNGASQFRIMVNSQAIAQWRADDHLPSGKMDADSATLRFLPAISLHPGDDIRIQGMPDGSEPAPFDYLELLPVNDGGAEGQADR